MTLNEIFRRSGEPTYYTPMAVVGQLVNQEGGTVVIGNPPFSTSQPKPKRWWKKSLRLFGGRIYLTFSNCRVKKRPTDGYSVQKYSKECKKIWKGKQEAYDKQGGCCAVCGQHFDYRIMEGHHIFPWGRFPELRDNKANIVMLCHDCHKEIHCDPWKNIRMMKSYAQEMGIDLNERYETGNIRDCEAEAEGTAEV